MERIEDNVIQRRVEDRGRIDKEENRERGGGRCKYYVVTCKDIKKHEKRDMTEEWRDGGK